MAKKFKNNIDVFKKYNTSKQNVENILTQADAKTVYLPKKIDIDDIDAEFIKLFSDGDFRLYINDTEDNDKKLVPSFLLTNERWGEFSKTWKFNDQDKNISFPIITIRKPNDFSPGTYSGVKYSIPNRRLFHYIEVPFYENDRYGYDIYSVPQPIAIDLNYEITFFSRYQLDVNLFSRLILKNFNSLQYYINVNGQYFRCILDGDISDDNTMDSIDGDRFYMPSIKVKVHGYLTDPDEFKVIKSFTRTIINTKVDNKTVNKNIL